MFRQNGNHFNLERFSLSLYINVSVTVVLAPRSKVTFASEWAILDGDVIIQYYLA